MNIDQEVKRPLWHGGKRAGMLATIALAGASGASLFMTAKAYGITGCRSDPLVTLSDGYRVRLVATINAPASQVTNVAYTLHIPKGLTVTDVQYDGGLPENLTWVADQGPVDNNGNAHFQDQVIATTSGANAPTTISATATNGAVENAAQNGGKSNGTIKQDFQFQPGSNSTCSGTATLSGRIPQDLTVPSGVACTVSSLSVGHNVVVQPGGVLNATNLTVGQGLQIQSGNMDGQPAYGTVNATALNVATDLKVSGGTVNLTDGNVGGNLELQNLSGSNTLCGIGGAKALTVQNELAGSSLMMGSAADGCSGNNFGQNAQIQNNAGSILLNGNTFSQDLSCRQNPNLTQSDNRVARQNNC